jgi:hypothetical protein
MFKYQSLKLEPDTTLLGQLTYHVVSYTKVLQLNGSK